MYHSNIKLGQIKIEDAKNLLGARIINDLKRTEYASYVSDFTDIDTILDLVVQTDMLDASSDRLTMKIIYFGSETIE